MTTYANCSNKKHKAHTYICQNGWNITEFKGELMFSVLKKINNNEQNSITEW